MLSTVNFGVMISEGFAESDCAELHQNPFLWWRNL